MRRLLVAVVGVLVIGFGVFTPSASAHRDGCHRWHSCPSDSGSYTCGDTGHYSECPSSQPEPVMSEPATTQPPPPPPTTTTAAPTTTTAPPTTTTTEPPTTTTTHVAVKDATKTTDAPATIVLDVEPVSDEEDADSGNALVGFGGLAALGYGAYRLRRRSKTAA